MARKSLESTTVRNELALTYQQEGEYKEAETLFIQGYRISLRHAVATNPNRIAATNNLARIYVNQGRFAEAKSYYEQALAASEKTLGPNNPDTGYHPLQSGQLA